MFFKVLTVGDLILSKQDFMTDTLRPGCKGMKYILLYPGIQFRLPCNPTGQFFMGAKLFIGTPWMGNEGVLKKVFGLGYVNSHGFYANP